MNHKTFLNRTFIAVLCIFLLWTFFACSHVGDPDVTDETTEAGISEMITGSTATLENDIIKTTFETEHGILVGITDKRTGREWLDSTRSFSGFNLFVDKSTGNIWKSHTSGPSVEKIRQISLNADMKKVIYENRQVIRTVQSFQAGDGNITVEQTVTLENGSDAVCFSAKISNTSTNCVVTSFRNVTISNINDNEEGLSLLWPNREGEIFEKALKPSTTVASNLTEIYPVPLSMQFCSLFSSKESLYFCVKDFERAYKTISFSHNSDGLGEISSTLWPFVRAGSEETCPEIEVGIVSDGNSWYTPAERYRNYLISSGFDKEHGELATQWVGLHENGMIGYQNQYHTRYGEMMKVVSEGKRNNGIPLTVFLGWHNDGFDSRYPDYCFSDEIGGESAFAKAMQDLDRIKGYAVIYVNLRIADKLGSWFNTENESGIKYGFSCAVRNDDNSVIQESYDSSGLSFNVMCPMASEYRKAITDAGERLAKNGADGLYLDQIEEMPASMCFCKDHGHRNPATAFAEGYDLILSELTDIFRRYNDNFIFMCEGTCDAYLKYIDVCGGNFTRLMDYAEYAKTEVARYIMPTKFYGRKTSKTETRHAVDYGHAFVIGNGIFAQNVNSTAKRLSDLMYANPEIYFTGRFIDHRGLVSEIPANVYLGIFVSSDGKNASVHVFNESDTEISFPVKIDAGLAGFSGDLKGIRNTETGEDADLDNIVIPPHGIVAYLLDIG